MTANGRTDIDIQRILELLPHRYPFILVDRVLSFVKGTSIEVLKNVTINEPFFQGHFPGKPVMPGVLILESMAQAGGIFVLLSSEESFDNKIFLFSGIDKVKFRRPVLPGDQIIHELGEMRQKFNIWKMNGFAKVNGEIVCEATLTAALVDKGDL